MGASRGVEGTVRSAGGRPAAIRRALVAVALGAAVLAVAGQAEGAYPGQNGRIAFVKADEEGHRNIYVMNADGSGQTNLTPGAETTGQGNGGTNPTWSPDGSRIAYASLSGDIWVMNADGTGQTPVVANSVLPAWSPDGTRIVFSSSSFNAQNGPDIFTANPNGTGITRLPTAPNFTDSDPTGGRRPPRRPRPRPPSRPRRPRPRPPRRRPASRRPPRRPRPPPRPRRSRRP